MLQFGILDVATPSPLELIFFWPFTLLLLLATGIIGGLIFVFIRNNRDNKMIEEYEKENMEENE